LVSNPAQRTISENLGTLKPGQKVTKEYLVRVTSTRDKDVVTNKACFTGDSTANDNPQSGCDPAVVTVTVPPVVKEPPVIPPTVTPPAGKGAQVLPATLPATGPESAFGIFTGISSLGYAAHRVVSRKRK